MLIKPILSRITIYPVKSFDGIDLKEAEITEGGCLLHDREYAITDEAGEFINGKNNSLIHSLRSEFDLKNKSISIRTNEETNWTRFHLNDEKHLIQEYLSNYFGQKALFTQNKTGRFLDVPDVSGATIVSNASLQSVSEWYSNLDLNETRKRFRTTLEIEGVEAFWEDQLFSKESDGIEFKIGNVTFFGNSPRERCVVPTRNPENGLVTHAFPKTFAKQRDASLPSWSKLKDYGHTYHLAVDCSIPNTEIGKIISVGDELEIVRM